MSTASHLFVAWIQAKGRNPGIPAPVAITPGIVRWHRPVPKNAGPTRRAGSACGAPVTQVWPDPVFPGRAELRHLPGLDRQMYTFVLLQIADHGE